MVYVCMENDQDSLAAALALNKAAGEHDSTIVACMSRNSGLSELIKGGGAIGNLHAFAMLEEAYKPGSLLGGTREILAVAIHEDYTADQRMQALSPLKTLRWHPGKSCRRASKSQTAIVQMRPWSN